jgi:ATP-binding cassette subfamily B (MDR/TAP) protein 1
MGEVEFTDVWFRYPSRPETPILQGFSLRVPAGQTVALVGESGCGKSTVMQLLLRFYDAESGTVTLDGADVRGVGVSWLRRQMGLVAQEPVRLLKAA